MTKSGTVAKATTSKRGKATEKISTADQSDHGGREDAETSIHEMSAHEENCDTSEHSDINESESCVGDDEYSPPEGMENFLFEDMFRTHVSSRVLANVRKRTPGCTEVIYTPPKTDLPLLSHM